MIIERSTHPSYSKSPLQRTLTTFSRRNRKPTGYDPVKADDLTRVRCYRSTYLVKFLGCHVLWNSCVMNCVVSQNWQVRLLRIDLLELRFKVVDSNSVTIQWVFDEGTFQRKERHNMPSEGQKHSAANASSGHPSN